MSDRSNRWAAWAGAVAFALLAPLANAGPNLVVNGGFETGDFSGWTVSGDTSSAVVDNGPGSAHSGTWGAVFFSSDSSGDPVTISQSFVTLAGTTYTIDFWLANIAADLADPASFSWAWNGVTQASIVAPESTTSFPYTEFTSYVMGTGLDELSFTFSNPQSFWLLDDVSAAPEPGTLALMGIALLAAGATRRKRKQD